jgi:hypothetical protein
MDARRPAPTAQAGRLCDPGKGGLEALLPFGRCEAGAGHCCRPDSRLQVPREFGQLLRMYGTSSDVIVSIELANCQGQLLVALEAGSVFVGLFTADGTYLPVRRR